jgi:hypothetical protein
LFLQRASYLSTSFTQALPRLGQLLAGWSPLSDPGLPLPHFAAWRPLLESEAAAQGSVLGPAGGADFGSDAYMRLVAELVLPPLRKELTNDWDPRWVLLLAAGAAPSMAVASGRFVSPSMPWGRLLLGPYLAWRCGCLYCLSVSFWYALMLLMWSTHTMFRCPAVRRLHYRRRRRRH